MSDISRATVLIFFLGLTVGESWRDWTDCPTACKCKWISGKKAAYCMNGDLRKIPHNLSSELQSLDLSENYLDKLPSEAFKYVGLVNLHKVVLKACHIKEVHIGAFKDLAILVEIDLSENKIHVLQPGTFKDNIKLRILIFNRNYIKKIESNLFINLHHIQTIDMSNCELNEIDDKAFYNVTNLLNLKLSNNYLTRVELSTFQDLVKLRSLELRDNPWKCDCHLREFVKWVKQRHLYADPTECIEPKHLNKESWINIVPENFACKPQIIWPPIGQSIIAESKDVNLGCKVTGDPMPEVHWVHNSRIISNSTRVKYNVNRYTIKTNILNSSEQSERWVNLTVNQVNTQDKGQFRCVAKNPGGLDEKNVTLVVYADGDGFIGVGNGNDSWPLIIGLATGIAALFIIASIMCCWFCCRHKQSQSKKSPTNTLPANGDIMHRITTSNEQEKSLLTVNPVQKPPRRCEAQITSSNDAVELSELNRKLLDDTSLQGTTCTGEDEQSVECLELRPASAVDKLAPEAHPPDLLAFPSRGHISPASSSTSNGFDNLSRASLYPAVQQSLNPSLQYNFGTLPYSRSHSPFSPVTPVVLPRQGYVTIPRRPRIPSWSSAPTPSLLDDPLSPIKAEPVYDNLGPRTTADGSSVLSLNKTFPENTRGRNATNYFHFDGSLRPSKSPMSPERDNKTEGILKRTCSAEGDIGPIRSKVAPKPPPKPKKGGPLFEDEGEDGTEV